MLNRIAGVRSLEKEGWESEKGIARKMHTFDWEINLCFILHMKNSQEKFVTKQSKNQRN